MRQRLPSKWRSVAALMAAGLGLASVCAASPSQGATAGGPSASPLSIVDHATSEAVIALSPKSGRFERQAAEDLAAYVKLMTGVALPIRNTQQQIDAALASGKPLILVGQAALAAKPGLNNKLRAVLKKEPYGRADGVVLSREENRIYLAGSDDESHYFAVAQLLRAWGVRWFMPGDFGECVPDETQLTVGDLDYAYAPPFEFRSFSVSWLGPETGVEAFRLRNMMIDWRTMPLVGHSLGQYTKGLGNGLFDVPLTDPKTADQVADGIQDAYAKGQTISLGMNDGIYSSSNPRDMALMALQWDKYSQHWSVTDPMLELLNGVAKRLKERHPDSTAKIGFFIYSNMFLPPKRDMTVDPLLFAMLAPIDTDPIHAMGDPQSPQKNEYLDILNRWAKLTHGHLIIYDYDQGMLVWRDFPNPSQQAFQTDVKRYRDAGVLGFVTESRLALATTGINLYLRGWLMWNPDQNVDALLEDFYAKFYGPARAPMRDYWRAIFDAWCDTIATEHEYFLAPAIYTPELVERLGGILAKAEKALDPLRERSKTLSRNEQRYLERLKFTRLTYETLKAYREMVTAGATNADYGAAVAAGEAGLRARDALGQMNPAFTTTKLERGPEFWPGEVDHYRDMRALVNGEKGRLVTLLPLEWSFHRDKNVKGAETGLLDGPVDLGFWRAHKDEYDLDKRKDYPSDQWEMARTDLYIQAQGLRDPDRQSYTGDLIYRTTVELRPGQLDMRTHVRFPGLFNNCELYVNGVEAGRHQQAEPWWISDKPFEWDLAIGETLREGANALALRCHNPHHMGGMFRRPFLYVPTAAATP
jgi:hypothetical protein